MAIRLTGDPRFFAWPPESKPDRPPEQGDRFHLLRGLESLACQEMRRFLITFKEARIDLRTIAAHLDHVGTDPPLVMKVLRNVEARFRR